MPNVNTYDLLKWLHLVAFAVAGGAAVVALLLSGFEDTREDLRGLAATVWSKVVAWGFRLAFLLGVVLLVMKIQAGDHPFDHRYLHFKITLAVLLLAFSEMAPRALARAKRGAAMLALMLFLLTSFLGVAGKSLLGRTPGGRERAVDPTPTLLTQ